MVLTTTATLTTAHDHHAEALQEFVLLIKFTGHPETADWQWSRFCELANSLNLAGIEPLAADRNAEIWQSVGGMALAREDPQQVMLKIIAPHRLTVSLTEEIARKAMNLSLVMRWISYAGAHVLWIALYPAAGAGLPVEPLAAWLESLRRQLRNDRGELIVAHAPRQLKDMLEVWGVEGKPLELMQGIKRQLDPKGILNPGRFVGRM
jgi:glycolate oxidase FAD binding subunit